MNEGLRECMCLASSFKVLKSEFLISGVEALQLLEVSSLSVSLPLPLTADSLCFSSKNTSTLSVATSCRVELGTHVLSPSVRQLLLKKALLPEDRCQEPWWSDGGSISPWWTQGWHWRAGYYEQVGLSSLFVYIPSDEMAGKPLQCLSCMVSTLATGSNMLRNDVWSSREYHLPPVRNSSFPMAPKIWWKDFIIHPTTPKGISFFLW